MHLGAKNHAKKHSITSTDNHSASTYKTFYSDSAGDVQELTHGASTQVLTSNGASANPSWEDATGSSFTGWDGWIDAGETWTYASATTYTNTNTTYEGTFTISGNVTTKYQIGMKVKFTQSVDGTKYGVITSVSYSVPNTTIKIFLGTSSDLDNATITSPYYSFSRVPFGFPSDPNMWKVSFSSSTDHSQTAPTIDVWYNIGTVSLNVPAGAWNLGYYVNLYNDDDIRNPHAQVALSTSSSSLSSSVWLSSHQMSLYTSSTDLFGFILLPANVESTISQTTNTTYYLIARTRKAGTDDLQFRGSNQPTVVEAKFMYL